MLIDFLVTELPGESSYRGGGGVNFTRGIKINPPLKVRADPISKRGFIFSRNLSNLKTGFYFFQKSQQSFYFFQKISPIVWHFLDPFWTPFLAFSPCKTPKIPPKIFARFARRVYFPSNLKSGFYFFPEISAISDSGFYFFQKSHQCFKSGFYLGGVNFISLVLGYKSDEFSDFVNICRSTDDGR